MAIQQARFFSSDPDQARSLKGVDLGEMFNSTIIAAANALQPPEELEVDLDGEDELARRRRQEREVLEEQGSLQRRQADDQFFAARGGLPVGDDFTDYSEDLSDGGGYTAPALPRPSGPASPAGPITGGLPERLTPLQSVFEEQGKKYGVDPKFLAAIAMHETGNGSSSAFRNKRNAMGVSNSKGPIAFNDPSESVAQMARLLGSRERGPYKKARTIDEIGSIYAPVGAGNDPRGLNSSWAAGVSKFYKQLGGDPGTPIK